MKLQKDLREFIELLNSLKVEYLVVGGHAVGWHGYPRFTGDIDFFVRLSATNADRIIDVLRSFGFTSDDQLRTDLLTPDKVIQLGRTPNRIDILTGISGVTFAEALGGCGKIDLHRKQDWYRISERVFEIRCRASL